MRENAFVSELWMTPASESRRRRFEVLWASK